MGMEPHIPDFSLEHELRSQYRVQPLVSIPLQTRILLANELSTGRVTDISARGVAVRLDHGIEGIQPGQVAEVRFTAPLATRSLVTCGVVRHWIPEPMVRSLGIEFLDWLGLLRRVPRAWRRWFNERAHPRLRMSRDRTVDVKVAIPARGSTRGFLWDISPGGIAVLSNGRLPKLPRGEEIALDFQLPGSWEPMRFTGILRATDLQGQLTCLRMLFDETLTSHFEAQQAAIERFIEEQLAAQLPPSPPR